MNTHNEPELNPMPEPDNTPSEAQVWQWLDALAAHYLARDVAKAVNEFGGADYLHSYAFRLFARISERRKIRWWVENGAVAVRWRGGGVVFCAASDHSPMGYIVSDDTFLVRPGILSTAVAEIRAKF